MIANNKLVREVFNSMLEDRVSRRWLRIIKGYKDLVGISFDQLKVMEGKEVRDRVREYGLEEWKREMNSKSTLRMYATYKEKIGEMEIYDNSYDSILMYRARTNTLKLGWRNRFEGGNVTCGLCGGEETLEHFLLECSRLREFREEGGFEEKQGIEGLLLFGRGGDDRVVRNRRLIGKLWRCREGMLREVG